MARRGLTLPVVFLTGHGDLPTGIRAMKKGAVDFLLKPVDDDRLLAAIEQAVRRHAVAQAQECARRALEQRLARLSAREHEVLEHVVAGRLNKQIAAALGIAEKTVKVHRGQVMEKLGVGSVAELVRLCEAAGVRSAPDPRG